MSSSRNLPRGWWPGSQEWATLAHWARHEELPSWPGCLGKIQGTCYSCRRGSRLLWMEGRRLPGKRHHWAGR